MSLRNRFGVFCFALIFVTAYTYAFAKPPTPDSPCATPHEKSPVLESFSIVHPTALDAIKSTIEGVLPPDIGFAIFVLHKKITNRITYDRKRKGSQFINELFLVDYPDTGDETRFAFIKVRVDEVDTLCRSDTATTTPTVVDERNLGRWVSVLLKGRIKEGVAVFGNPKGDDYTFSFAYIVEPGDASQFMLCADGSDVFDHPFRDLNSVDPGRASDYAACADGSITFKAHPADDD
jgi:hypothetical protein